MRRAMGLLVCAAMSAGCLEDPLETVPDAAPRADVTQADRAPTDVATPRDLVAQDTPEDAPRDATAELAADASDVALMDGTIDDAMDAARDGGGEAAADVPRDVVGGDAADAMDAADAPRDAADAAVDVARDASDAAMDAPADNGFFGAPRCGDAGFSVCEDFEGDAGYDRDVWTTYANNGTVVVETTRAARGTHSLHVHTHAPAVDGGTGANVGIRVTRGFPPVANSYFGRAFVWMDTRSPTTHSTLFESGGTLPDGGQGVSQRFSISGHQLEASYDSFPRPPTTDYARRSATAMPLNRWACLEWQFKGDTNELHFWLDGAELTDMTVLPSRVPTWFAPPWVRVNVGLQLYRPDPEPDFDAWIDEVVIDDTRVGCTR